MTTFSFQPREATPDDAEEISRLSSQLGYPGTTDSFRTRLREYGHSSDHMVYVVPDHDGQLVGWIHLFVARLLQESAFVEIGGLVVAESHRGEGIGRLLMSTAETWSVDHGYTVLRVRSRRERESTKAFYEHLDFTVSKEQRIFDKVLTDN